MVDADGENRVLQLTPSIQEVCQNLSLTFKGKFNLSFLQRNVGLVTLRYHVKIDNNEEMEGLSIHTYFLR